MENNDELISTFLAESIKFEEEIRRLKYALVLAIPWIGLDPSNSPVIIEASPKVKAQNIAACEKALDTAMECFPPGTHSPSNYEPRKKEIY